MAFSINTVFNCTVPQDVASGIPGGPVGPNEWNANLAFKGATSGGLIYAASATLPACSALLTAGSPVLGGGAGNPPLTDAGFTTTGTGGTFVATLNSLTVTQAPTFSALTQYRVPVTGASGLIGDSSGLTFGGAAAGTGLAIAAGTATTAVSPFSLTATYNNAGTVFPGVQWTFTETADANGTFFFNILAGASGLTSVFQVTKGGSVQCTGGMTASSYLTATGQYIQFGSRSFIDSPADGNIALHNNAGTGFTALQFGGTTSSFPELKRSGATLATRLADDSADAALSASIFTASTSVVPSANGTASLGSAAVGFKSIYLDYTNTATVGNVIINKPSGRVILGAGGTSLTLTNSLITAASRIFVSADSAPGNIVAVQFYAVPGSGSCTINAVPAVTNQTNIDFLVINAD